MNCWIEHFWQLWVTVKVTSPTVKLFKCDLSCSTWLRFLQTWTIISHTIVACDHKIFNWNEASWGPSVTTEPLSFNCGCKQYFCRRSANCMHEIKIAVRNKYYTRVNCISRTLEAVSISQRIRAAAGSRTAVGQRVQVSWEIDEADLSWSTADDPRTPRRATAVVILTLVDDDAADEASVSAGV